MGDNDNNNGQDNNNKNNDKGNNNNQQNQNQQDNKGQNQQDNKGQNQKNNNVADNGNGNNNANEGQALSNESNVIAPGPWLIDFTVGFLLFVALAIFPMSILGRKFRKSRKARRRKKEAKKKTGARNWRKYEHLHGSHPSLIDWRHGESGNIYGGQTRIG
mmetsp:Transcript_24018/g.35228  ORF Transcript_24018/g.35228 Transcript_24018/m.35228 type:complete len:160 (-) Transcript_24018:2655-3134(-)